MPRFSLADRNFASLQLLLLASGLHVATTEAHADSAQTSPASQVVAYDQIVALPTVAEQQLQRINSLIAGNELVEADVAAKQWVEQILASEPLDRPLAALALGRLALVQHLSDDHVAAEQNYGAAINLISSTNNRLSPLLIEPLTGLAATQRARAETGDAVATYERALHISHVNFGPHSLSQIGLLNEMLEITLANDDSDAAFAMLNRLQRLYERNYSSRSVELVPVLRQRAALLRALERYSDERQVQRDIVTILIDDGGADNPALIPTYQALADTYIKEVNGVVFRSEPTTENGETWLKRALLIAEERNDTAPEVLLDCLLALGDYYMMLDVQDKARSAYRRASQLLSSDAALADHGDLFAQPVLLGRPTLSPYADFAYGWELEHISNDELLGGHITASYKVTRRGRVTDIAIVEADPANFEAMETRVKRSLRDFIFRPRYVNGRPVASEGYRFRHEFEYRSADLQGGQTY